MGNLIWSTFQNIRLLKSLQSVLTNPISILDATSQQYKPAKKSNAAELVSTDNFIAISIFFSPITICIFSDELFSIIFISELTFVSVTGFFVCVCVRGVWPKRRASIDICYGSRKACVHAAHFFFFFIFCRFCEQYGFSDRTKYVSCQTTVSRHCFADIKLSIQT